MPPQTEEPANSSNGSHPSPAELASYARGEILNDDSCAQLEAHLATCHACQELTANAESDGFVHRIAQLDADAPNGGSLRLALGYKILEEIGRGGAGIVYRARHPRLPRDVALKILNSGGRPSRSELVRFEREAKALALLKHPGIVEVYDVGEQDGLPYLAMEYVKGVTLAEHLKGHGPAEALWAAKLVRELALAVSHAHAAGIVHRDLKPQNVLLDGDSRPKIADFGLSRFITTSSLSQTRTGDLLGTPGYTAPEQLEGEHKIAGPRVDVYGLGAILYDCLAGRPPFRGATVMETLQLVTNHDVVEIIRYRREIAIELQTICLKCLERDPHQRYASAEELIADLDRFLAHEPILARPRHWTVHAAAWFRRNPWPSAALGLVVFAVCAVVTSLIWHQRGLERQRHQAHQQYAQARQTIWSMIRRASAESELQIPRLAQMSLAQIRDALTLFERLAKEENSPESASDLAEIRMLAATVCIRLGKANQGEELLGRVVAQLERQMESDPSSHSLSRQLVSAKVKLAMALMIRQQFQRAEQLLLEARACASSWFGKARDEVTRLNDVAWAEHTLGNLYWHQGQTEQARDMYQSSIKLREQVIRQDPENRAVRGFLVETRVNLAQVESQAGNFAVADAEFQRVTDELQEIHEQKPDDVATRYSIAATCLNRSNLASARSNLPLAVDYCTQGIDTVQPVVDAQPDDHIARDLLCRLYGNRGIYRRLSEPDLAVVDWRNSVEYATTKDVRHYCQTMLIRSQVASGDVAEAFRCAQQAEMELPSPENQFRMAAAWSMIAQALLPERRDADSDPNVRRWHGSSMEHRPEVPQADAAGGSAPHVTAISEAFRHLRSLFAAGHFDRDASAREELRGGSDCNVLWVIILQ